MQTLNGYKLTQDGVHLRDVHIKCAGQAGTRYHLGVVGRQLQRTGKAGLIQ